MPNFGNCIDWVLRLEDRALSGITKDLGDGAGLTRYGVTQKNNADLPGDFFTKDRVAALEDAKNVYHAKYWLPIHGIAFQTDELAATLLSFAVNDGVIEAIKLLQRCVGAKDDGVFGPDTLMAVQKVSTEALVASGLRARQELFHRAVVAANPARIVDLDGWLRRDQTVYPDLS